MAANDNNSSNTAGDGELSLTEAAELLDVHYMTAYRYVRTGRLDGRREAGRWLIELRQVERFRSMQLGSRQPTDSADLEEWLRRYKSRILAADQLGAWQVLDDCRAAGHDSLPVLQGVIEPAIATIGAGWASGTTSLAVERQATVVMEQHIGRLLPGVSRRGPSRGTVVIGCMAGERHDIGLLVLSGILRAEGFVPINLGADAPVEAFVTSIDSAERIVAVGIGSHNKSSRALKAFLADLRVAMPDHPVMVGGHAVTSASVDHSGADHVSRDLAVTTDWLKQVAAPT